MKSVVLVFFCCCSLIAFAQPLSQKDSTQFAQVLNEFRFRDTIKTRLMYDAVTQKYSFETRDISVNTFDSLFKPIYAKVMLGSSDLVNQGSAYALTVNQFESKFTLNYNWAHDKKNIGGWYYNAGFAASSSSKVVPVFSKDEWQQGFTLSLGVVKSFGKSIFYDRGEDFDKVRRRALLLSIKETKAVFQADTIKFYLQDNKFNILTDTIWKDVDLLKKAVGEIDYKGVKDFKAARDEFQRASFLRALDSAGIARYVDSCFTAFETDYFKKYNYSFFWFNAIFRPEYKGLSIYDTAAARVAGVKRRSYFRAGIDLLLNYAKSTNNSLLLVQVGTGFKNTNYLEGRKAADVEFLQEALTNTSEITKLDQAIIVDDYEKYKKQFLLITPQLGANLFVGKKRMFGWEAFFSAKLGLNSSDIPYDNLFTFRTGPLFSINGKDDLAKSTFGLIAQWEDVKFQSAQFKDGFTFSIRIGIPFNF